jgi:hypothetical protein
MNNIEREAFHATASVEKTDGAAVDSYVCRSDRLRRGDGQSTEANSSEIVLDGGVVTHPAKLPRSGLNR